MKPDSVLLRTVVEETLASMAFLFPSGGEPQAPAPGETLALSVAFDGPSHGRLEMVLPKALLAPLAVNMLGLDEPGQLTGEQAVDAAKEVLNVVCGNLLPQIDDPKAVYNVSPPEAGCSVEGEPAADTELDVEGHLVQVRLFQTCPAA